MHTLTNMKLTAVRIPITHNYGVLEIDQTFLASHIDTM